MRVREGELKNLTQGTQQFTGVARLCSCPPLAYIAKLLLLARPAATFRLDRTVLCLAAADELVCFQEQWVFIQDQRLEAKFHFSFI
jgi:hypothetical protein